MGINEREVRLMIHRISHFVYKKNLRHFETPIKRTRLIRLSKNPERDTR